MGISVKEIVTGRKTFFITPDTSLIPESYLEDYFALGYECYFVENDKRVLGRAVQGGYGARISLFELVCRKTKLDKNTAINPYWRKRYYGKSFI